MVTLIKPERYKKTKLAKSLIPLTIPPIIYNPNKEKATFRFPGYAFFCV